MKKVNYFFIIGAQRSGTTLLYHLLDKHPQISMAKPIRPEPKFFLQITPQTNIQDYLNNYHPTQNTDIRAYGEKSTSYYEKPKVAARIAQYFPEAKIIMLLRNPVERAISNYFFTRQHGLETRTLEEVFIQKIPAPSIPKNISVSPFDYIKRGCYTQYLPIYIEKFGRNKVKTLIFDNFIANPQNDLNHIFDFFEINQQDIQIPFEGQNASNKTQVILPEVMEQLNNYYSSEINQLEHLINTDLSIWKKSIPNPKIKQNT